MRLLIRALNDSDHEVISAAFTKMGWNKPADKYRGYLAEQAAGKRSVLVALRDGTFAGYVTVNWQPAYAFFASKNIPAIEDFNVLSDFRRQGIGSALLDRAEKMISERSKLAGIGVGLHPGYGSAQRLYVKRGYIPDGRPVTYKYEPVAEGAQVKLDDDLVLWFVKVLGDSLME